MKNKSKLILLLIFFILVFSSCNNTIWTGEEYSGEITDSSKSGDNSYYEQYYIYCAGNWEFEFTGDGSVYNVWLEAKDDLSNAKIIDQLSSNYGETVKKTATLLGTTRVNVCVMKKNPFFILNNNKAKFNFKATLK